MGCGEDSPPTVEFDTECGFPPGDCGLEDDAVELGLDTLSTVNPEEAVGACGGGYVFEFSTAVMEGTDLWLSRLWGNGLSSTEDECLGRLLEVFVWRKQQGDDWEAVPFDAYDVESQYLDDISECQSLGAGKLGPDEDNVHAGYARSWIETTGIETVRVVIMATEHCEPIPVIVNFSETP